MGNPKALVVDDQEMFRDAMTTELQFLGFDTTSAEDGLLALEKCRTEKFDLIMSDMRMPRCDGKQFLIEFRKTNPITPPFIIMTGFTDMRLSEAYALGADAFLGKPLNPDRLEEIVKKIQMPITKRWDSTCEKDNTVIKKRFDSWESTERLQQLNLGRIGFSITQIQELSLLSIKSKVAFEFEFEIGPFRLLAGCGEVVWIDTSESFGHREIVGIEIDALDDACRDDVIRYLNSVRPVESIPYLQV